MNNKGFTLVELISVVSIIALLAVITTPVYDSLSTSVKTKNYDSKKETIKTQTLSFAEKYLKDEIKSAEGTKSYCFTINFLIRNGIINSDDEKEEYIKNDITDEEYSKDKKYIMITYDMDALKLKAMIYDDIKDAAEKSCKVTCDELCEEKE